MDNKQSNFGIKALKNIYKKKHLFKGSKYPIILTLVVYLFHSFSNIINSQDLLIIVELIISSIPSFLGFVLSGYALLIGFGNINFIAKSSKNSNESTLYQKLSAVFSAGLLVQIFTLIIAFCLKPIILMDLPCYSDFYFICDSINLGIYGVLIFGLFYSTFLIKDMVINIFNYSQLQHLMINKSNEKD